MRRAAARLVYVMCKQKVLAVPNLIELCLENAEDPWTSSFLLAAEALTFPIENLSGIQTEDFSGHYQDAGRLIPHLIMQFEQAHGTMASRYFSSIILERMSHCLPEVDIIAQRDFDNVVKCLFSQCPQSYTDNRTENTMAILLASVILNVWRRLAAIRAPNHSILFSQVLMPLFDVLGIKGERNPASNLSIVQSMFLEVLRHIASFEDLSGSVKSAQMLEILREFAVVEGELGVQAQQTLDFLVK
jgi:hypothetical protein